MKNEKNTSSKANSPIKAFLLSAALFPGLGQYTQGKRILGITIMLGVSICTYIVFSEAFSEINAAAQRMAQSGSADFLRAHSESQAIIQNLKTPKFLAGFYGLIGLWLFSMIEVFRQPKN